MSKTTDGNKITIKKEIEFKPNFNSFLAVFLIFLIIFNVGAAIFLISSHLEDTAQIEALEEKVQALESGNKNVQGTQAANDYYRELSDKTDSAIDRILTVVGIIAAIVALFGILLAFKAPHDIEKQLDELKELTVKAQDAAKNAEYQTRIVEALNFDYDGEPNDEKRIEKLNKVIKDYPDKFHAYMQRAITYHRMSKKLEGDEKNKLLHFAAADYEVAHNFGARTRAYLNNMGNIYSALEEYEKAVQFYTKALDEEETDQARCFYNRGLTYYKMIEKTGEAEEKIRLCKLAEKDVLTASGMEQKREFENLSGRIADKLNKLSEQKEPQPVE